MQWQSEGRGDSLVGHPTLVNVDPFGESGVGGRQIPPAVLYQLQHIGQCDIAQCIGAGSSDGACHISNAVMDHADHEIGERLRWPADIRV